MSRSTSLVEETGRELIAALDAEEVLRTESDARALAERRAPADDASAVASLVDASLDLYARRRAALLRRHDAEREHLAALRAALGPEEAPDSPGPDAVRTDECCVPAPGEPSFVLLGRDPQAPDLVEKWANDREVVEPGSAKLAAAREVAAAMRRYRAAAPRRRRFGVRDARP